MSTILIVDDAAFIRKQLRDIVEDLGHTVIAEAANGVDAIRYYDLYRPDIVTMDITMPIMDGLLATERILQLNASANIVVCSAFSQRELVIRLINIGAKDYIVKPFQKERVKQALENIGRL